MLYIVVISTLRIYKLQYCILFWLCCLYKCMIFQNYNIVDYFDFAVLICMLYYYSAIYFLYNRSLCLLIMQTKKLANKFAKEQSLKRI